MAERQLDGMRVAIVVNTEFEQVELTEPRKALEGAGATTAIVSPKPPPAAGEKRPGSQKRSKKDVFLNPETVVLPFPDRPPRYVRALYYEYRFTAREERQRTGLWWNRDLLGLYYSPVMLKSADEQREPALK